METVLKLRSHPVSPFKPRDGLATVNGAVWAHLSALAGGERSLSCDRRHRWLDQSFPAEG